MPERWSAGGGRLSQAFGGQVSSRVGGGSARVGVEPAGHGVGSRRSSSSRERPRSPATSSRVPSSGVPSSGRRRTVRGSCAATPRTAPVSTASPARRPEGAARWASSAPPDTAVPSRPARSGTGRPAGAAATSTTRRRTPRPAAAGPLRHPRLHHVGCPPDRWSRGRVGSRRVPRGSSRSAKGGPGLSENGPTGWCGHRSHSRPVDGPARWMRCECLAPVLEWLAVSRRDVHRGLGKATWRTSALSDTPDGRDRSGRPQRNRWELRQTVR